MKRKELSRRAFITKAAASAAAVTIGACDKRNPMGTDIRKPSAPTGLQAAYRSGGVIQLSWKKHPLTDLDNSPTETAVIYRVYRDGSLLTPSDLEANAYTDTQIVEDSVYSYAVTAVDASGNESTLSAAARVRAGGKTRLSIFQSASLAPGGKIDAAAVRIVLDAAIKDFTGISDIGAAYESLFPDITAAKTIAVKVNCLAVAIPTHPQIVEALVGGLTRMLGGTFPAYNVIVFDDRDMATQMAPSGYPARNEAGRYRCQTTKGNWISTPAAGSTTQFLSKVVNDADYLVNIPILKVHPESGVTFSLKNYYGIISNPAGAHGNYCNPMIAEIYSLAVDKTRLIIGDAIFGSYNGDNTTPPNISPAPCSLYVGTDPVAMDLYALWRINKERQNKNRPVISCAADGMARHITTAGSAPYYLGDLGFIPSDGMETIL